MDGNGNGDNKSVLSGEMGSEPSKSGDFNRPGAQPPPDPKHEWIPPGDVGKPPPVPGGSDHPGKGVTVVNTEAMRTFAKNLQSLADGPIKSLPDKLEGVQLKPGVFLTAQEKIVKPITGPGGLRDTTKSAIHDLSKALDEVAEAVNTAAKAYESADEANKMSVDQYNQYFNRVSGHITNAGQQR